MKQHKQVKGLKNQNLRDHMSEAELIFTALAELSTRQIAEAGKKGGTISKKARLELEQETGRNVVTGENFLPPVRSRKQLNKRADADES